MNSAGCVACQVNWSRHFGAGILEQVAAGMFWLSLKFQESRVLPGGVELWNAGISGHARQQARGLPAGG